MIKVKMIWIYSALFSLVRGFTIPCSRCPLDWVKSKQIGDGICDLSCMSPYCSFDSPLSSDIASSDCYARCLLSGCPKESLNNNQCDSLCDNIECAFDFGECGFCGSGCFLSDLEDSSCKAECSNLSCFYDSSACKECSKGCSNSMLGDGTCQKECNFSICGFDFGDCDSSSTECSEGCSSENLGNKKCEDACNVEDCNFDDFDCLCSEECLPSLTQNQECDQQCNTESCEFDSCGEECSTECKLEMINNGTCEEKCWNEECDWDGSDCGCSSNCKFEDIQNCKDECLVKDCEDFLDQCSDSFKKEFARAYQMIKGDLNAIASYEECTRKSSEDYNTGPCDQTKLANKTDCIEECDIEECGYSWGNCVSVCDYCKTCFENTENGCLSCEADKLQFFSFCLDNCPVGFEANSNSICVPKEDTSSLSDPYLYYIDSSNTDFGDGSVLNPFNSLSVALVSIYSKYSVVYLNSSVYLDSLPSNYPLSFLASSLDDPLNRSSFEPVYLKIEGQESISSMTIRSSEMMKFLVKERLELENVKITSESLDSSCSGNYCNYCAHITCSESLCLSDRGERVYSYFSKCSDFHSVDLLRVQGLLVLSNVEFRDLRMELNSLIFLEEGGSLQMQNTHFIQIRIRSDIKSSVIYSDSQPGSITFTNGSVQLLNDGYEIDTQRLSFNPFIFVKNIYTFRIDSISFDFNTVYAFDKNFDRTFGLISLRSFSKMEVVNCTFSYNFVPHGILFVEYAPIPTFTIVDGTIYEMSIDNIVIKDSNFVNNYIDTNSMIELVFENSLQNVLIENIEIKYNGVSQNSLISITSDELKEEYKEDSYVKVKTGSEYELGFRKRRTVVFRNLRVELCFVTENGIFYIENLAHILFESMSILNMKTDNFEVDQYVTDFLIQNHESYITRKTSIVKVPILINLSYISNNYSIEMLDIEMRENNIVAYQFGIILYLGTRAVLDTINVVSNTFNILGGSQLAISDIDEITVRNSWFRENINESTRGCAGFSVLGNHPSKTTVQNCEFSSNIAHYASALYVFSYDFVVEDTQFINNVILSRLGSSLTHMLGSPMNTISGIFRNLYFEGNRAEGSSAGAIYMWNFNEASYSYTMQISDCNFQSNFAHGYGSALYISDKINFEGNSYIRNCNFTNNTSLVGTIAIINTKGTLALEQSNILSNDGSDSAIIYVKTNQIFTLHLTEVLIASNNASTVVFCESIDNKLSIYTENCIFESNLGSELIVTLRANWFDNNSTFQNNLISYGGAATLTEYSHASLTNTHFENNTSIQGAAIYIANFSGLECENCIFRYNKAQKSGGALYSENSYFSLKYSEISFNTAQEYGSALYVYGKSSGSNIIYDSKIFYNLSILQYTLFFTNTEIRVANLTFYENTSQMLLSGIYLHSSSLSIDSSQIFNQQSSYGSVIFGTENTLTIQNTLIHDIRAYERAAVLYLSTSTVSLLNCTFYNIQAPEFSLFRIDSYSTVLVESSNFYSIYSNNQPNIYVSLSSLSIKDTSIGYFNGTAIYSLENDLVLIDNSVFISGNNARALFSLSTARVLIHGSTFQSITTDQEEGTVYIYSNPSVHTSSEIQGNLFCENQASKGGSIYIENIDSDISNNEFLANKAYNEAYSQLDIDQESYGSGGAVYIKNEAENQVSISNNIFRENEASLAGGAISWESYSPLFANNSYVDNQALYGSDVSSFPVRIWPWNNTVPLRITHVSSGEILANPLNIALLDHYDQVVKSDNKSECYLQAVSENIELSGVTKETAKEGIFYFDRFSVVSKPNSSVSLKVISPSTNSSVQVDIEIRACDIGEITKEDKCLYCSEGTYSLEQSDWECKSCLNNAICLGGDKLGPKEGFWKSRNSSETLIQCPNKKACLGSSLENFAYQGECERGYKGNKCQSCEHGFYRFKLNLCEECRSNALNIIVLLFYSILGLLVVLCVSKVVKFCVFRPTSFSVVYVKQFINYLDLIGLIAHLEMSYPSYFDKFISFQTYLDVYSQILYSVECLLDSSYFYKLLFTLLFPVALALVYLIILRLFYLFRKGIILAKHSDRLYVLVTVYLLYVGVMRIMVTPLRCIEIEPDEYWVLNENDEDCLNSVDYFYTLAISILGILIWGILIHIFLFFYVKKHRNKLYEHRMNYVLGFVCLGYSRENYCWEFLIIARKLIIVIILVLIESKVIKCLSIMATLMISLYFQFKKKPFLEKELNDLETRCLTCCILIIYSGLFFEAGTPDDFFSITISVFSIFLVVYVFIFLLLKILKLAVRDWFAVHKGDYKRQLSRKQSFRERSPHIKGEGQNIQFVFAEKTIGNENYVNPNANMNDLLLYRFYHDVIDDRQNITRNNIDIEEDSDFVIEDLSS